MLLQFSESDNQYWIDVTKFVGEGRIKITKASTHSIRFDIQWKRKIEMAYAMAFQFRLIGLFLINKNRKMHQQIE
ncbi:hypothetical protein JM83_3880 [Gillisia sp. Hel_I_86]|nr:hypothetical protein JM83_3880 [Gillisia sp. Hel_I_86]